MDEIQDVINYIPLLAILLITCIFLFLVFEIGVFLGRRHRIRSEFENITIVSSIVGAMIGLLVFLLVFTFSLAATKFDNRRDLIVDEANAIGTTYLRAGYLEDSYQKQIRNFLREYVSIRLDALSPKELARGIKRSEELQSLLWQQAEAVAQKTPNSVVYGLFIQSLNQMIDLHEKRLFLATQFRIPSIIWIALYFIALLAIGSLGYQNGLIPTGYLGISILSIITFASVITLIFDLDRPSEGFIRVSQQSLINLLDKMK